MGATPAPKAGAGQGPSPPHQQVMSPSIEQGDDEGTRPRPTNLRGLLRALQNAVRLAEQAASAGQTAQGQAMADMEVDAGNTPNQVATLVEQLQLAEARGTAPPQEPMRAIQQHTQVVMQHYGIPPSEVAQYLVLCEQRAQQVLTEEEQRLRTHVASRLTEAMNDLENRWTGAVVELRSLETRESQQYQQELAQVAEETRLVTTHVEAAAQHMVQVEQHQHQEAQTLRQESVDAEGLCQRALLEERDVQALREVAVQLTGQEQQEAATVQHVLGRLHLEQRELEQLRGQVEQHRGLRGDSEALTEYAARTNVQLDGSSKSVMEWRSSINSS